ncbi:hypothetical protein GGR54DRAFT_647502 [Hypoxylon sp. NC1633]|nr:hypothetical protein GGR54DRAFT_647502 [Hypoxylon sp. NC1633]
MRPNLIPVTMLLTLFGPSTIAAAVPRPTSRFSNNTSSISWSKCDDDGTGPIPGLVQCGVLMVPLNHFDPNCHTTIKIGMTRIRASSMAQRQGTLFLNNGGPGQPSGPSLVKQAQLESQRLLAQANFRKPIRDTFELVGVDMRGTGRSEPLTCDANLLNAPDGSLITNNDQYRRAIAQSRAVGESCARMNRLLFYYISTNQALRDFDISYGTQLRSEYAETFPHNVGRIVLDGVFDRAISREALLLEGAVGYESTLNRFSQWCNETTSCALHGRDVPAMFDEIVASAPLLAPECEGKGCKATIGPDDFIFAVLAGAAGLHDGDPKPPAPQTRGWFDLAERLAAHMEEMPPSSLRPTRHRTLLQRRQRICLTLISLCRSSEEKSLGR